MTSARDLTTWWLVDRFSPRSMRDFWDRQKATLCSRAIVPNRLTKVFLLWRPRRLTLRAPLCPVAHREREPHQSRKEQDHNQPAHDIRELGGAEGGPAELP